jgi:chemotaxis signal transduction protein
VNPTNQLPLSPKAHELRRAFDAVFAAPPPPPAPPTRAFLLVRAGGELLALPRNQIAGILRGQSVARAPGGAVAFLGLVEAHNSFHPVWSLAGLLRQAPQSGSATAWLVLAEIAREIRCAFACDAIERMILVPESEITAPARPSEAALAQTGAGLVPIVEMSALHAEILKRKESK